MRELLQAGSKNLEWFARNYTELQAKYPEKFVAVYECKVVESDSSLVALLSRIRNVVNLASTLVQFIPARGTALVV